MSEFASSGMTAALTALPTLSAEMMTFENFMSMCGCIDLEVKCVVSRYGVGVRVVCKSPMYEVGQWVDKYLLVK
jgi:hypothetical protein